MGECGICGAKVPDNPAHEVIHVQQEHPQVYEELLEGYLRDVNRLRDGGEASDG